MALPTLVVLLVAPVALIVASVPAASGPWAKLRRPLRIPHVASGAPCPVTPKARSPHGYGGFVLGRGPAYPVYPWQAGTLSFVYPVRPKQGTWYPSDWSGDKVLWIVAPRYRGPVLIRGRQVDGPTVLRFGDGSLPPAELRIPAGGVASTGGYRNEGGYTRLRTSGCYGWQVDETSFSRVIVFRAAVILQ